VADIFSAQRDQIVSPAILTAMYSLAGLLDVFDRLIEFVHFCWLMGNVAFMDQEIGERGVDRDLRGLRR